MNREKNVIVDEREPRDLRQSEVSAEMERSVDALCALKISLDRYARQWMGQPFMDDWMDSHNTCAYFGDSFLRLILPFMDWEPSEPRDYYRAYVNPRYVLGASIKGRPEHIDDDKVAEKIALYSTHFGSRDNACYIRYPALGLYYAHEGKHRVAFMRAHEQPAIAAWVRDANYPTPERIVLIAPTDERDEWLALLDKRYLQVLRRPRLSQQLLTTYGVKTVRWKTVPGLPDEQCVREAIYARRLHREPTTTAELDRTLDLEDVRQQQREEAAFVERTILDLEPLRLAWRPYFATVVACAVLGLVLSVIPFDGARAVGWGLTGVACGLATAVSLQRFRAPRRVVLERPRQ
ncbi:hypothetical protein [Ralstonia insidiosa]|nr:hypothetical protein [Ralstonia insidiosa]